MTLADQIALMQNGKIVQCHDPRTLYNEPEDIFGGWFLGNPGMNFIKKECCKEGGQYIIASSLFKGKLHIDTDQIDRKVTIGIRSEHVQVGTTSSKYAVEAVVKNKTLTIGGQYLFTLDIGGRTIKAKVDNFAGSTHQGQRAWVELPLKHVVVFNSAERRMHGAMAIQQTDLRDY